MSYEVGASVQYKPQGGPGGLFTIVRRMPRSVRRAGLPNKERLGVLREERP
jgi:hypothetical protein